MKVIVTILFILAFHLLQAQPFIDLVNIKYNKSPDAGLFRRDKQPASFDNFVINLNLPFIFKKDSSTLIFSPFTESWYLQINNTRFLPDQFQSFAFQTTYIEPISKNWTATISLIPRWNGYNGHLFDNNFQLGAALLATYKKNTTLKYKFGIYYNSEFSGAFFMPLMGIDWKINSKNTVFGVLPGSLAWEHKVTNTFYYGVIFRAITNSYQSGSLNNKTYFMRIDDNQLSLYSDLHVTKKIVFIAEAGHSVFRRFRLGYNSGSEKYFYKEKINDNWLLKAGIAYRLRL